MVSYLIVHFLLQYNVFSLIKQLFCTFFLSIVEKRCELLMDEAKSITQQLDVKLTATMMRLPKKIKVMQMTEFMSQSDQLMAPPPTGNEKKPLGN